MVGSSEINQVIRICLVILENIGIGDFSPFMIYTDVLKKHNTNFPLYLSK